MRNCPTCSVLISYIEYKSCDLANKGNTICSRCNAKNKNSKKEYSRTCTKCSETLYYSRKDSYNKAISNNTICHPCHLEIRKLIAKNKPATPNVIYHRNCNVCGDRLEYKSEKSYIQANRRNTPCKSCTRFKIPYNPKLNRYCSICNAEILYTDRNMYRQACLRNSICTVCAKNKMYSDESQKKKRIKLLDRISKIHFNGGRVIPGYNFNACKFINILNKTYGWNMIHAENGGEFYIKELGYYLDGYDEEKNIAFEYDEPYHHFDINGFLLKKDINRMSEIIKSIRCRFFRYNERTKELREYTLHEKELDYNI